MSNTTAGLLVHSERNADVVAKVAAAFGELGLLITESRDAYLHLRKTILEDLSPVGAVEVTLALRYIDCCWRIQRYQRCSAGITNLTFKAALTRILGEHATDGIEGLTAQQIADAWFSDSKIKELALRHLKRVAVDEGMVIAQALAMRSGELVVIDDMQAKAEAEALAILRELERRREAKARITALQASQAGNGNSLEHPAAAPGSPARAQHNQ